MSFTRKYVTCAGRPCHYPLLLRPEVECLQRGLDRLAAQPYAPHELLWQSEPIRSVYAQPPRCCMLRPSPHYVEVFRLPKRLPILLLTRHLTACVRSSPDLELRNNIRCATMALQRPRGLAEHLFERGIEILKEGLDIFLRRAATYEFAAPIESGGLILLRCLAWQWALMARTFAQQAKTMHRMHPERRRLFTTTPPEKYLLPPFPSSSRVYMAGYRLREEISGITTGRPTVQAAYLLHIQRIRPTHYDVAVVSPHNEGLIGEARAQTMAYGLMGYFFDALNAPPPQPSLVKCPEDD